MSDTTSSAGRFPTTPLARWIGKAPSEFTVDDLVDCVADRDVRVISLMHVGGDGFLKTLDFVPRSPAHVRDVLEGGERADGSSIFPRLGFPADASDILIRPRPGRAFLDPFAPDRTLVVLCGHRDRRGGPLPESPDTIVREAWKRLHSSHGVDLRALGEVEYFLGKRTEEGDVPGKSERGYHGTAPFVFGQDLRRRALAILAEIGVGVKYGHSEVGYVEAGNGDEHTWEQHEIELALAPLPEAADAVSLTRWVLMNLARREGKRISLEPIVRVGHAGSGLHVHFSPVVEGEHCGGRNDAGELRDPAKWLIGGLVRTGGALMAFGNRVESSFIRLNQGREAPRGVTWGDFDRSALVRLPVVVRAEDGRIVSPPTVEFRLPDGSAHPHLLLAGVAQAACEAATRNDVDATLAATRSERARVQPDAVSPVPRSFAGVRKALREHRETFSADGVFPDRLLDRAVRDA